MSKPKQHPQTALTGRLGVNLVERIVTRMGHAWNETTMDAGIDGMIELCRPDTREALNRVVLVQSKATKAIFPKETVGEFEWPCDPRDVDYWIGGNAPVILVVSRSLGDEDEAYWMDVKRYFADPVARRLARVRFDKRRDRFDEGCAGALMELGAPTSDGLYTAPAPRTETLLSNLLRLAFYAPTLYVADTEYREEDALWRHFSERGTKPTGEWALWERRIYSFLDLNREPFRSICDLGTLEPIETGYLAQSADRDLTNVFIRLLRKSLREKLWPLKVRFDSSDKYYHFMADRELRGYSYDYQGPQVPTDRRVFVRYPDKRDPKKAVYYRHSAFSGQFLRFDGDWYLEITPTYRFTSDGRQVHPLAADLLKKIKEIERNSAVAGQVRMWAHILQTPGDLVRPAYPFVTFGNLAEFKIDVGLDDASWHPADPSARSADDLGDDDTLDLFAEVDDAP